MEWHGTEQDRRAEESRMELEVISVKSQSKYSRFCGPPGFIPEAVAYHKLRRKWQSS